METSSLKTGRLQILGAPAVPNKVKNLTLAPRLSFPRGRLKQGTAVCCIAPSDGGGGGSVPEAERELAEEGEEMGRWVEKCGGQGLVELLECLEREAIMGEDEGKEPGDYSRRARIFDRSSRVFRALRETDVEPSAGTR